MKIIKKSTIFVTLFLIKLQFCFATIVSGSGKNYGNTIQQQTKSVTSLTHTSLFGSKLTSLIIMLLVLMVVFAGYKVYRFISLMDRDKEGESLLEQSGPLIAIISGVGIILTICGVTFSSVLNLN